MLIKISSIYLPIVSICLAPLLAGPEHDLLNYEVFPANNVWKWDISEYQVHPNSDNFIASMGPDNTLHPDVGTEWNGAPIGIPYVLVGEGQAGVPITYTAYGNESDPGPFPIPLDAPIEGGPSSDGDRHVIAVDTSGHMLYELYRGFPQSDSWEAESGAAFDLTVNDEHPETWTSADAAGLPIFPGLVRYDEVYIKKEVNHAIRMTVSVSQRKYIWPARHFASSNTSPDVPPMGLRFRMKAAYDISGFSEPVQIILLAMKKHGLIVADNGADWFFQGAPDQRWDDGVLGEMKSIPGSAFEAVLTVDAQGDPILPYASVENTIRIDRPEFRPYLIFVNGRYGNSMDGLRIGNTFYSLLGRKTTGRVPASIQIYIKQGEQ